VNVGGVQRRTIWPGDSGETVLVIDQRDLPHRWSVATLATPDQVFEAIATMVVRGAPLIGVTAAYGMALQCIVDPADAALKAAAAKLNAARPTAVNLAWATQRMLSQLVVEPLARRRERAFAIAGAMAEDDVAINAAIAAHGLALLRELPRRLGRTRLNLLTHCNAGWLATVDWGTALAPVYAAHAAGLDVHVWVDETRPRNQGASLTAWELGQAGVAHTVVADNAGGHLMQHGEVDAVIVGADRVSAQGDVCNKIGTYLKALAAADNGIPFYAAVPLSTLDRSVHDALRDIPIEERSGREVTHITGIDAQGTHREVSIVPAGTVARNPAFDVTPARLVTALITERGAVAPSFERLQALAGQEVAHA
jgi:methylthioribose-1-phosphate isomerase